MDELDEIRLRIAKAKGWRDNGIMNDGAHEFYNPAGGRDQYLYINGHPFCDSELPDWPRDISAAWELAEELSQNFFRVYVMRGDIDDCWTVECDPRHGHNEPSGAFWKDGATAPEAICRAWLEWKERQA